MAVTWDLGSRTTSDGKAARRQTLCSGMDCRPVIGFAAEPPNNVSSQVEHVVGALAQGLIFQRLELLIPALEHPADDPLRGQQRSSELRARTRPSRPGPATWCHVRERCRPAPNRIPTRSAGPSRPAPRRFHQRNAAGARIRGPRSILLDRWTECRPGSSTSPTTQARPMPKPGAMLRPAERTSCCPPSVAARFVLPSTFPR